MFRPAVIAAFALLSSTNAMAQPTVSYNRDIRPILAKHCWACHGFDEKARQADLRLDSFVVATEVRDDHAAIRANDPEHSELMLRVLSEDEDSVMPPRQGGTPLTESQIELLRQWIAAGAEYEKHWAFVPPVRPPLPQVEHSQWVRHPIDQFVLAKIELAMLATSPAADRATLLRRVYLDLIGMPPSPAEITKFLESQDDHEYERVVDSLLARPEFGEKWGRSWLDLARYSDTNGYEKDRTRAIWPYRDWVINAINADMPFDQFTVQQIAGDMLAPNDLQSKIATGFHRNTMLNEEGGIDPLEFRFYAMNDRVATTGLVWMGLTTGCAQCHTHKFDPITHTEYYQFMALLNNADEPDQEVVLPTLEAERSRIESEIEAKSERLPTQFPFDGSAANELTLEDRSTKSQLAFQ